jgi:16S rRNA (cytosine967-C5)-methyltransferase
LKWRLSSEFLAQIEAKQREILKFYAGMLQSGGKLVYATCSLFPSENERQIEWFLSQNPDFQMEEQKVISPRRDELRRIFYSATL